MVSLVAGLTFRSDAGADTVEKLIARVKIRSSDAVRVSWISVGPWKPQKRFLGLKPVTREFGRITINHHSCALRRLGTSEDCVHCKATLIPITFVSWRLFGIRRVN